MIEAGRHASCASNGRLHTRQDFRGLKCRHPLGKLAPMRVTVARSAGQVVEAKLRWFGRKFLG